MVAECVTDFSMQQRGQNFHFCFVVYKRVSSLVFGLLDKFCELFVHAFVNAAVFHELVQSRNQGICHAPSGFDSDRQVPYRTRASVGPDTVGSRAKCKGGARRKPREMQAREAQCGASEKAPSREGRKKRNAVFHESTNSREKELELGGPTVGAAAPPRGRASDK